MGRSRKKTIEFHRRHWDWCYRNPTKLKRDYPEFESNGGRIKDPDNYCFLCEYGLARERTYCNNSCLIDWGNDGGCMEVLSFYSRWCEAKTLKTKKKYAKLIRDLPERKRK